MKRTLAGVFVVMVCAASTFGDIIISANVYEAGTTTPLAQPINVGDMFDLVLSSSDTLGSGLIFGAVEWTFDGSLVSQDPVASWTFDSGYQYLTPSTGETANGGIVEFAHFSTPPASFDMVRIKYTATAQGTASFTTAGFIQGDPPNPAFTTFSTADGRGFLANGDPANAAATGEEIMFGSVAVEIVPEPATLSLLFLGLTGVALRSRRMMR